MKTMTILPTTLVALLVATHPMSSSPPPPTLKSTSTIEKTFALLYNATTFPRIASATLVLGTTGVGKTTLTKILATDNSLLLSIETGAGSGKYNIKDPGSDKIGDSNTESKTLVPELFLDEKTNIAFYDCPGFRDTRGTHFDIAATFYTHELAKTVENVRFIFVVSYASVEQGGSRENFLNLLTHISDMIKDVDRYAPGMIMVVNKVPNRKVGGVLIPEDVINRLINDYMLDVLNYLKTQDSKPHQQVRNRQIKTLEIFLVPGKVVIFSSPDKAGPLVEIEMVQTQRVKVYETIKSAKNIPTVDGDFGFTVSDKSKNELHGLIEEGFRKAGLEIGKMLKYWEQARIKSIKNEPELPTLAQQFSNDLPVVEELLNSSADTIWDVVWLVKDAFDSVGIRIPRNMMKSALKYDGYLSFFFQVGGKKTSFTKEHYDFDGILEFTLKQKTWSEFMVFFEEYLYSWEVQKARLGNHNGVNVSRWGLEGNVTNGIYITLQNFGIFFDKIVEARKEFEGFRDVKGIASEMHVGQVNVVLWEAVRSPYEYKIDGNIYMIWTNVIILNPATYSQWECFYFVTKKVFLYGHLNIEKDFVIIAPVVEVVGENVIVNPMGKERVDFPAKQGAIIQPDYPADFIKCQNKDNCYKNEVCLAQCEKTYHDAHLNFRVAWGPAYAISERGYGSNQLGPNFALFAGKIINHQNLYIISEGGKGGKGQDGRDTRVDDHYLTQFDTWHGGNAGYGGYGGYPGAVHVHVPSTSTMPLIIMRAGSNGPVGACGTGLWGSCYYMSEPWMVYDQEWPSASANDPVNTLNWEQWKKRNALLAQLKSFRQTRTFDLPSQILNYKKYTTPLISTTTLPSMLRFWQNLDDATMFNTAHFGIEFTDITQNTTNAGRKVGIVRLESFLKRVVALDGAPNVGSTAFVMSCDVGEFRDQFALWTDYKWAKPPHHTTPLVADVFQFSSCSYTRSNISEVSPDLKKTRFLFHTFANTELDLYKKPAPVDITDYLEPCIEFVGDLDVLAIKDSAKTLLQVHKLAIDGSIKQASDAFSKLFQPTITAHLLKADLKITSTLTTLNMTQSESPSLVKNIKVKNTFSAFYFFGHFLNTVPIVEMELVNLANKGVAIDFEEKEGLDQSTITAAKAKQTKILTFLKSQDEQDFEIALITIQNDMENIHHEKKDSFSKLLNSYRNVSEINYQEKRNIRKRMTAVLVSLGLMEADNSSLAVWKYAPTFQLYNYLNQYQKITPKSIKELVQVEKLYEKVKEKVYSTMLPIMQGLGFIISQANATKPSHLKVNPNQWQMIEPIKIIRTLLQDYFDAINIKPDANLAVMMDEQITRVLNVQTSLNAFKTDQAGVDNLMVMTGGKFQGITGGNKTTLDNAMDRTKANIAFYHYNRVKTAFFNYVFPFAHEFSGQFLGLKEFKKGNNIAENLLKIKANFVQQREKVKDKAEKYRISALFSDLTASTPPFFAWKPSLDLISDLLSGREIFLKSDILSSPIGYDAIKFTTIQLQLRCNDSTFQSDLSSFTMSMTHTGINYYRLDNKFYVLSTAVREIRYSFEMTNNEPVKTNAVYNQVKRGELSLSPYTLWRCKLIQGDLNKLEKYLGKEVELVMIGTGSYIEAGEVNVGGLQLGKYYQRDEMILLDNELEVEEVEGVNKKGKRIMAVMRKGGRRVWKGNGTVGVVKKGKGNGTRKSGTSERRN